MGKKGILALSMLLEFVVPPAFALEPMERLARTPASDVKKLGWRGVMKAVSAHGKVLVTNHDTPEAVIIPAADYNAMRELLREAASRDEAMLDALRDRYDQRLKWLMQPGADEAITALFGAPLDLGGKVFDGGGF